MAHPTMPVFCTTQLAPKNTVPKHHKHRSQGSGFFYIYLHIHLLTQGLERPYTDSGMLCFPSLLKSLHSGNALSDYHQVNKNLYVGYVGRTTFKPRFNMQDLTFTWGLISRLLSTKM